MVMMATQDDMDGAVTALLDALRTETPRPSDDLMSRVLADAEALQPETEVILAGPAVAAPAADRGWLHLIGGWPAASGLAAAGVMGLWLGYAPPGGLDGVTDAFVGDPLAVSWIETPEDWLLGGDAL